MHIIRVFTGSPTNSRPGSTQNDETSNYEENQPAGTACIPPLPQPILRRDTKEDINLITTTPKMTLQNQNNDDKCYQGVTMDDAPKFSGDDLTYASTRWAQDLEDNAEIFGWSPQQLLIMARRSLTGTAELWLRTEKVFKSYEDLKTALLKEFPETTNVKQMHELMSNRKKKPSESCYQYMLIMKELGKRAKFPDYVAIQYIIDGISDNESNKMLLYGVTTYPALKEKMALYETFKTKTKKQITASVNRPFKQPLRAEPEKTRQRCFKCGDVGHLSNSCPKGLKCFRCNSFGHIGANCPANSRSFGGNGDDRHRRQSMFIQDMQQKSTEGASVESERNEQFGSERNELHLPRSIHSDPDGEQTSNNSFVHLTINSFPASCQNQTIFNVNKDETINRCVKIVKIGNLTVKCLIDTGSDLNLIKYELFCRLNITKCQPSAMSLTGLGSWKVHSLGEFTAQIVLDSHNYCNVRFQIVPNDAIPYKIILGQPFLLNTITVIDRGLVEVRPHYYDSSYLMCVLPDFEREKYSDIPAVQNIIDSYQPLKTKEAPIKLRIVLKDDIPVSQKPRRLALTEEEIVRNQVADWLQKGIIRPSYSEYASPLVLVKKKDGNTRVCVDYRKINQKMVKDEHPLPVIDDHIDKLSKARVFSTLDLKNGFFHLPIEEDSIKYTAFVTSSPEGQYEFLRAPFGLSICPKYFTRYINIIFSDFIRRGIILIFIDDVIIMSENEKQGIQQLQEVLKVAAEYGLEINWKKTQLLQRSVEYLGHIVSNGSVSPSLEKTKAVSNFPLPKGLKEVHSFIGLTSYFRKFIQNYAMICRPLSDLLKKKEFCFGEEQMHAFQTLKAKLCCEPVLKIFDNQLETELHTDASKLGYAAILLQKDPVDGHLHPVHFMSRKTTEAQQNCSSYELEALAVVEGVKKFRRYLFGRPFKILTDCEAFQKTLNKKDVPAKVARWIMFLQDFDYTIEHRNGDKMQHVDSLSRNICLVTVELHARLQKAQDEDDELKVVKEILKEKEYEDYFLDRDIIYKGVEKKLVIPEGMDVEIIQRAHGIGHFGKKKIKDIVERDYYIKKLDSKIEKVIAMCVPCLLASRKSGKKEGLLNPIDKGDLPLDTLHCDHLGPLDATKKLYNYILTVVDAYTKFVWIYPVKTVTAKETIEKLKFHQKDYGNPRRFVTDRGAAFTGNEFKEYCQGEDIEHVMITTGIPRGNGQVERINRIIISTLAKMCVDQPGHWYKHVSQLQRVINGTYQRSINTSPFELLTGTKLRLKEDMQIIEFMEEEGRQEYVDRRDSLRREAKVQILKIQEENKRTFNKRRKEGEKYQVGDIVAIQRTQFGNTLKLKPKFFGPYKVVREIGKDRYEVEKIDNSKEGPRKTTTGVDYMKRWP